MVTGQPAALSVSLPLDSYHFHTFHPFRYCDPVMATGWHMVLGSLPLVAVSAAQEGSGLAERLTQLTGATPTPHDIIHLTMREFNRPSASSSS